MKQNLREKYLIVRDNIISRDIKDNAIFNKVINDEMVKNSSLILTYVSFNNEVDTIRLIEELLKTKKLAVPKIEKGEMRFYFISSFDDLEKGTFNILEPRTKTIVEDFSNSCSIVPGICFNKSGYRIGYGKGYYDRFLTGYQGYSIGLTYRECLIDENFQEDHDVKVKKIICN